jgi:hypothetical protein
VQNRFYGWRDSGLWEQILAVLMMAVREAHGKNASPTVVIADSQSVKTTEAGGPGGYMMLVRRSRGGNAISRSIRSACRSSAPSRPPMFRTATPCPHC